MWPLRAVEPVWEAKAGTRTGRKGQKAQIEDTAALLRTIVSLQPKVSQDGEESNESRILRIASGMEEQVPQPLDAEEIHSAMEARSDPDPMKTVLFQEVDRYNKLLVRVRSKLYRCTAFHCLSVEIHCRLWFSRHW